MMIDYTNMSHKEIEEFIETLSFSGDVWRIVNNEERDLADALWTYLDRNPIANKEIERKHPNS